MADSGCAAYPSAETVSTPVPSFLFNKIKALTSVMDRIATPLPLL
jgi:hypothetical protein